MRKKIVYVVNVDWFFLSHRLPLALVAIKKDWEVFLVTKNTGRFEELAQYNIECIDINFERSGKNPFTELSIIAQLKRIYKKINPEIIHHVTLKPSIYGTIAAKSLKAPVRVINAVSGLGYSFTDGRKSIATMILIGLLKWAFNDKSANFIFQNPDDQKLYHDFSFLTPKNNIIIKGSGVDENKFPYTLPFQNQKLQVILLARILKDKGVLEFIEAAKSLKDRFQNVKFLLVGAIDLENPAHIKKEELIELCDSGHVEWLGYRTDIKEIYQAADIIVLPSYREGLPKSLVEAMAVGRPIITTDAIGCRECVDEGINGFLVPIKDSILLAKRIEVLLVNESMRLEMGKNSRQKMINEMSLNQVINKTFLFYEA